MTLNSDDEEFDFDDIFNDPYNEDNEENNNNNIEVNKENNLIETSQIIDELKVEIKEDEEGNFSINFDEEHNKQIEGENNKNIPSTKKKLALEDFEFLKLVGKGAYGKVHQVRKKDNGQIYALKVLRKELLKQTNNITYTITERNIMRNIRFPFLASLHFAFQTKGKVYLGMDFLNGGQLFYHMKREAMFSEEDVQFYAAEMVLAISHLHSHNIIHRDLKPENILLGSDGHVCLADFGLAKVDVESDDCNTFCGTVEYMAPEIIKGVGHGKAVDWWSLGILIYDMLNGGPPFQAKNQYSLEKKIIRGKYKRPKYLSSKSANIIKSLLSVNPEKRLGSGENGLENIKSHQFFKGIDWKILLDKKIDPPFLPIQQSNDLDTSCFDKKYTKIHNGDSYISPSELNRLTNSIEEHFLGFSYVRSFDGLDCIQISTDDDDIEYEEEEISEEEENFEFNLNINETDTNVDVKICP